MWDRATGLSHRSSKKHGAPGSVWFHDIVLPCVATSCRPQVRGVGDVVGSLTSGAPGRRYSVT
jgi:hypothetical protein